MNADKDSGKQSHTNARTGIFSKFKTYINRNRLGELLVYKGALTPQQLKDALKLQKEQKQPLGKILVEQKLVGARQLRFMLLRQTTLRYTAALLFCTASLGSYKRAQADFLKDIPEAVSISATQHFQAVAHYPALFGSDEKKSKNLKPFVKWTGMFDKFERSIQSSQAQDVINKWKIQLQHFEDLPLDKMADKVNDFVNAKRYIIDNKNWGKSDYWATPVEFLTRGGDCEDFAITKYASLRALGVPDERLRIAIVHDNVKNIPHAVLVVYTEQGPKILDNQSKRVLDGNAQGRYKPIFSINRQAWWLHTEPTDKRTILASVE